MSKFKLTQTAAEVQGILNNSLQKPTGLTKTKLVGVGVNGQENIEIGDNLTLANGKLSSGVNGLESDAEGNLTASKNLEVDGKLKLKSLVSASNPDGDITKELGGGGGGGGGGGSGSARHGYTIFVKDAAVDNESFTSNFHYEIYTTKNYNLTIGTENAIADFLTNEGYKELRAIGSYPAAGYFLQRTTVSGVVWKYTITATRNLVYIYRTDNNANEFKGLNKPTFTVVQLF